MDYKIQKFTPSYLKSLTELLDKCFTNNNEDKLGLVNWKLSHKAHNHRTITYIALDDSNNVVGQYTNLPIKLSFMNKVYNSMICVDMATHPEHRGKGLITQLSQQVYEEVVKSGYDFTIGFSNDEGVKVDKNSGSYGYKVVDKFASYFKLLVYRKHLDAKIVLIKHFDEKHEVINHSNFFKIYKDSQYLNWRYIEKPNNAYRVYKITFKKVLAGYVVLRFSDTKCYVNDILLNNHGEKNISQVLQCIENEAIDHGARIIVYHLLDNKYWQELLNKFLYYKKTSSKNNYYLTIKIHNPAIESEIILDKENWLLMNGDIL